MTRVLIPRSDNRNAKKIETSDFESFFNDFLCDYIQCGMTMTAQCPNVLAVDVAAGKMRLGGIYLENTTPDVVTCLLPCDTNYVYASLCRDPNCEPQAWLFQSNITGVTPADSMIIGTVDTNCSGVVACGISQVAENEVGGITGLKKKHSLKDASLGWFGSGGDGCVTISSNTVLCETMYYRNLTVDPGWTLSSSTSPQLIYVRCTLTVNGTITMNAVGACGGAGGAGGTSPAGNGSNGSAGCAATNYNISGGAGGTAASSGAGGASGGAAGTAGGGSGAGGNGGGSGAPPAPQGGTVGVTSTATGGAGGPTVTQAKTVYNLMEYVSAKTNLLAAGGGGGGGAAAGGKGGDGGEKGPNGGTGGAGGSGAAGGTGGKGGGTLIIAAQNIIVGTCGIIQANGGDGSSGGNGSPGSGGQPNPSQDAGGGGGGGGGAGGAGTGGGGGGGMIGLYYYSLINNGTIQAAGGGSAANTSSGGSGGSGGAGGPNPDGKPGQPGGAGAGALSPTEANGASGTPGLVLEVPLK